MTTSFDLLRADLAAKRDQLSPRLRQIADYALRNPNDMALETIAVIAERAQGAALEPDPLCQRVRL